MDWANELSNINYWAILLATLSSFAVGASWYAWGIFGKEWSRLIGLTKEELEKPEGMTQTYLLTAVGSLVSATALAALMRATDTDGVLEGIGFGLVIGIAFRMSAHVMHNGFAKINHKLTLIDGVHDIVQLGVMGAILGGLL